MIGQRFGTGHNKSWSCSIYLHPLVQYHRMSCNKFSRRLQMSNPMAERYHHTCIHKNTLTLHGCLGESRSNRFPPFLAKDALASLLHTLFLLLYPMLFLLGFPVLFLLLFIQVAGSVSSGFFPGNIRTIVRIYPCHASCIMIWGGRHGMPLGRRYVKPCLKCANMIKNQEYL